MNVMLDSSVIVAALAPDEEKHAQSLALLIQGGNMVYAHALLETFSTLTSGKLGMRVDADLASQLLSQTVVPRVQIVELGSKELIEALQQARKLGVRGGGVYDYMHFVAARKARAEIFYTINQRHFIPLHREGDPEIRCP
jgi:predicted nucleic acid-binding protein